MISKLKAKLEDTQTPLSRKYRVLFALKNLKSDEAVEAMLVGLNDESTLLRHEVAYCIGQTQNKAAVTRLTEILDDVNEHPMVRHEAGEALGAIGCDECVAPLARHAGDKHQEVRQTCQLALKRIQRMGSQKGEDRDCGYASVDPAPAAAEDRPTKELGAVLLDEEGDMFDRYKALFALRNLGGEEAIRAICEAFQSESALLKHEVAFVLGQMQDKRAIKVLRSVLENKLENPMVRHEAAEALGSIADDSSVELLKRYSKDSEMIVADSCVVALDMLEHEQSEEFEYVDSGYC